VCAGAEHISVESLSRRSGEQSSLSAGRLTDISRFCAV
jgi:hypothetical protein